MTGMTEMAGCRGGPKANVRSTPYLFVGKYLTCFKSWELTLAFRCEFWSVP